MILRRPTEHEKIGERFLASAWNDNKVKGARRIIDRSPQDAIHVGPRPRIVSSPTENTICPHPRPLPSEWAREFLSKEFSPLLPSPACGRGKGEGRSARR
jgi:hypothetical protein